METWGFREPTVRYMEDLGFAEFTPIQKEAFRAMGKGRDFIGVSETGTGKTHAYLIPALDRIDPSKGGVQACVIAPTRELARQIYQMALPYKRQEPKLRIRLVSSEIPREREAFSPDRQPQLVIGTPGRLSDAFLREGALRLDQADLLVIDEADMSAEYGFLGDLDAIAGHMKQNLQMAAFSATMPQQLKIFLTHYMHQPVSVQLIGKEKGPSLVQHKLIPSREHPYEQTLLKILPGFHPYLCLIFANSREECDRAYGWMKEAGYDAIEIHGGLSDRERKAAMKRIRAMKAPYIVATDVAARGIDIPGISHVVSLGFPRETEYYIHRAGRTGRMNHTGVCYALYNRSDDGAIRELQRMGVQFHHADFRNGRWVELQPYGARRKKKETEMDREIRRIVTKPVKKVKPGYRKKRAAQVEKIRRKNRRQMIQANIRKLSHEKNRLRQIEKEQENSSR